jgi:hypothetical protein
VLDCLLFYRKKKIYCVIIANCCKIAIHVERGRAVSVWPRAQEASSRS